MRSHHTDINNAGGFNAGNQGYRETPSAPSIVEGPLAKVTSQTSSIGSNLSSQLSSFYLCSSSAQLPSSTNLSSKNAVLPRTPGNLDPHTSTKNTSSSPTGPNRRIRTSGAWVARSARPSHHRDHRERGAHAWPHPPINEDSDFEADSITERRSAGGLNLTRLDSHRLLQSPQQAPSGPKPPDTFPPQSSLEASNTRSSNGGASRPDDTPGNWGHQDLTAMARNPHLKLAAERTSRFQLRREQVTVRRGRIAQGSYGIVWKGGFHTFERFLPWRPLEVIVAIKVIRARVPDHERLLKSLFREIIPLCGLEEHPNIVSIQGYLLNGDSAWIVTKWQERGNAIDYLRENRNADCLSIILDVVSGLCYLHSRHPPIVHGDLKGDNVLVGVDHTAKLADFGLARILEDTLAGAYTTSSTLRGCLHFLAPELLSGSMRTMESDVWALGGLILQIASGYLPFHGMKKRDVLAALHAAQAPSLDHYQEFPHMSLLRPVIEGCWRIEPNDRWTASEVASYLQRHIPSRNH